MKYANSLLRPLFLLLLISLAGGAVAMGAEKPQPQEIADKVSCGVCGMYPARYPEWQTQVIFKDGSMVPFDGAKDMFKYLLNMAAYRQDQQRSTVAAIWVKGHDTGGWLDGEIAHYVVGSSVMGPMGAELAPFATAAAAKEFQAKNGGTIRRFDEITLEMVNKLGMGGMRMGGPMTGR